MPAVAAFFAVLAVLGVGIHRDFGLTWDEVGIHEYGDLLFDHYPPGGAWEDYSNLRYYGPVVALLTAGVRRLSSSPEAAYPLAHLLYFALFLGGVYAFYKLCARQFAGWGWGLFGATLLVASPRVFSHAFVNPKDTPLMAAFIVAIYLLTRFLDTRRPKWMALCGVATAVAIDIRVAGVFLVVLVVGSVLADALHRPPGPGSESAGSHGSRDTLVALGAFAATAAPLTILLWPYLWPNPVGRLLDTLQIMAFFDTGPQHTLYRGEMVSIRDTPWHYLPVWMGITTPLPYVALAAVGMGRLVSGRPSRDRHFLLYAAWLFVPVLVIVARNTALYDEWRQVLFIYPALLLFAVAGAKWLLDSAGSLSLALALGWDRQLQAVLVAGALAMVGWTVFRMVELHPYQALYFNAAVGEAAGAEGRFELDYWGLSYREGLDHLLSTTSGPVKVHACFAPGPAVDNARLFADGDRLLYVPLEEAGYAICTPRAGTPIPYLPEHPTVYGVRRDGATILYVKRLTPVPTGSAAGVPGA